MASRDPGREEDVLPRCPRLASLLGPHSPGTLFPASTAGLSGSHLDFRTVEACSVTHNELRALDRELKPYMRAAERREAVDRQHAAVLFQFIGRVS